MNGFLVMRRSGVRLPKAAHLADQITCRSSSARRARPVVRTDSSARQRTAAWRGWNASLARSTCAWAFLVTQRPSHRPAAVIRRGGLHGPAGKRRRMLSIFGHVLGHELLPTHASATRRATCSASADLVLRRRTRQRSDYGLDDLRKGIKGAASGGTGACTQRLPCSKPFLSRSAVAGSTGSDYERLGGVHAALRQQAEETDCTSLSSGDDDDLVCP